MNVLIVESRKELGGLWSRHLARLGATVTVAQTEEAATEHLHDTPIDVIVLDLVLAEGSALAVADFANYRWPEAKVIFVTNTSFFSDGSIFQLCSNACAFLPSATPPSDLAAMVEHFGQHEPR
ncbi:response regulator transcription factor [Salipiger sp.]|uniref:response regulator transcription factor n=1 Tax=Salipiger sp. TaxID=2078585 RepID=UPI003A96DCFE